MRVFVTGATGYIGSAVVAALVRAGHRVAGLSRSDAKDDLLKRLGADPAVSSAPFVATLVDVTGLVIYFSMAYLFMSGTLL